eukprot:gene12534-12623_t
MRSGEDGAGLSEAGAGRGQTYAQWPSAPARSTSKRIENFKFTRISEIRQINGPNPGRLDIVSTERIERHFDHLASLERNLRSLGLPEQSIEDNDDPMFELEEHNLLQCARPDAGGADEAARLEALYRYNVLDTRPEEGFDRITRLAKTVMNTPIVLISLVDRERQWFKSRIGLGIEQSPRDISFCTHAIKSADPLIVCDAAVDPIFQSNPFVAGPPNVRFYMGVPLRTHDNFNIGTLCLIDMVPRVPRPEQVAVMQDLAGLVVDELELRQIADTDSLTSTMTRRSFMREGRRAMEQANRSGASMSCLVLDIDHFKAVNDMYGHAAGDLALRCVASTCHNVLRSMDLFGRLGGEEFAILLPDTGVGGAVATAERLLREIAAAVVVTPAGPIKLTVSLGVSCFAGGGISLDTMLAEADASLYDAKRSGRNRVVVSTGSDDAALDDTGECEARDGVDLRSAEVLN